MERNLANIYQVELYKTKKIISKLKDLGLNTTNYENTVYDIEEICKNNNKMDLKRSFYTPFVTNYLEDNYSIAIDRLRIVQEELSKYDIYTKVSLFTNIFKNIVKDNKITPKQLDEIVPQLISVLNDLNKIKTLDYTVEKNIIENIYKITYYLLKEEIKLDKTTLYNFLLKDEVNTIYLDKEISIELEQLNKNDTKNNDVFSRKNLLDLKGFNSHYLDYELLRLLVKVNKQEEDINELFKLTSLYQEIDNKLGIYKEKLNNISHKVKVNNDHILYYKKLSRYLKNIGRIAVSASLITALFGGAYFLARKDNYDHPSLRKTYITTYDSRDNSEKTAEAFYAKSKEYTEGVNVIKYEPYIRKNGNFYRYITTYNLGDINNLTNEEILKIDFDNLDIKSDKKKDTTDTLNYENIYNNVFYIISKVQVDNNDCIVDKEKLILDIIGIEMLATIAYIVLVHGINFVIKYPNKLSYNTSIELIKGIKNIRNDIKNIKKYDREKEKYIQEKNKIISEVKDFLDKYNTELIILFNQADFICEYNDDEVAMVLRRTLESINNNLAFIEEKEQGTIVKDTVSKIRKRTR